jgi:hypothetical protein
MPVLTLASLGFEVTPVFAALDTNVARHERSKAYEVVGIDLATAAANAAGFITDLGAVTESDIIGYRFTQVFGTADVVTAVANLYKELVVTFQLSSAANKKEIHTLPAPADAILTGGLVVDPANAAVASWIANYMAAGGIRISDGESIAAVSPILRSRVRSVSSGKSYA